MSTLNAFEFTRPRKDRRTEERDNVDYNAMIILDGKTPVSCKITDYSPLGARLEVESPTDLPDRFGLYIPKTQRSHSALVRNRMGNGVGVEFVSQNGQSTD